MPGAQGVLTGMANISKTGEDRGGDVTLPGAGGGPDRPVAPERTANAGPVAEDEVTEWFSAVAPGRAGTGPATGDDPGLTAPGSWWPGTRVTACAVLAGLVIGALAATGVRHYSRPSADAVAASRQAAIRDEAASWVTQQVSRQVRVSCDPAVCAALRTHGFPARDLLTLGPASRSAAITAVVVETSVVRQLFGTSLDAAWAPDVLASFGSGADRITVRVIAPHGAAAYQVLLRTGLAAREKAGAALLRDPRVTIPAAAAGQLDSGLVDSRLLRVLAALARRQPISILGFGTAGPGVSAGLPLRFADLAENDPAAHLTRTAYLSSLRAHLNTMRTTFGLTPVTTVVPPYGPSVLRVQVTAPSPPGGGLSVTVPSAVPSSPPPSLRWLVRQ
jgi:hypothetical protein